MPDFNATMGEVEPMRMPSFQLLFGAILSMAFIAALSIPSSASTNAIGSATITQDVCSKNGLAGGTCYRVVVSNCPEDATQFAAGIKVNQPLNASLLQGTVFFTTGGGGQEYYDFDSSYKGNTLCTGSNCGLMVVQQINAANYRTVQVNFTDPAARIKESAGWLTGHTTDGPRALACRYATLVHAVWTILLNSDTAHAVCGTGNSGGGALLAYAITQYGMGNAGGPGPMFTMVEPTSGPPYGRIDHGCAGTAAPVASVSCPLGALVSENYGLQTASDFVDPSYSSAVCKNDINSNGKKPYANFWHDSNLSDDFPAPNYKTIVRNLYGSLDLGAPVPLGSEWYDAITSSKSAGCISGAPHELPGNYEGAITIISDVISLCK